MWSDRAHHWHPGATLGSTGRPAATQSCEICGFQVPCDFRRFVERLREICVAAGIRGEGNGSEAVNIGVKAGIGGSLSQQRKLRKIKAPRALSRFLILFNMNAHSNAYEIQTQGFKIIMPWKSLFTKKARHNVSRYKSWVIYIKFISQYICNDFTGD